MTTEGTTAVWRDHPGYLQAWAANIAAAGYFGVTGIAGAPTRFSSPTWDGLRDSLTVPGWSAVLLAYSLLLAAGAWLTARQMIGLFLAGGAVYLAIAAYFAVGLPDQYAAPWGPGAFGVLGVWQCTQAEAYRQGLLQLRVRFPKES